jgi:PAS domain S-box-containing protein
MYVVHADLSALRTSESEYLLILTFITGMINLIETGRIKTQIAAAPQQVAAIIETTPIGICITNDLGHYVAVNDAYCRIYQFSRQELMGQSFTMVVPEEYRESMQVLHRKFLRDKREIARQWTVLTKAGEPIKIWVDAAYSDAIFTQRPHKITFVQPG